MNAVLLVANIVVLVAVIGLAFLVLGALRALGVLTWRLDQMEAMRPSRIGREGLKVGRKAPDFTLPVVNSSPHAPREEAHRSPHAPREGAHLAERDGYTVSLSDFAGRKVLLVLTQSGCGPCMEIVPELNRLHDRGEYQVLVVNNGEPEATSQWVAETKARFAVLAQEKFSLSKRYEVFVTPFAFLIDEQGVITSKGIAGSREYLGYVLSGAGRKNEHVAANGEGSDKCSSEETDSLFN
jgi:peroxiredoxin